MTAFLRCTHENWPKVVSCMLDRILLWKAINVIRMTKITIFNENLQILAVLRETIHNGQQSDDKLTNH